MASKKSALQLRRSEIIELVSHAVEVQLHEGETARVVFDDHIPEIHGRGTRQVDSAIYVTSGRRTYLRIVEVQNRSRPIGHQSLDWVVGKAQQIGANKVTLVATKGFTKTAIERIERDHASIIDAVELRTPLPGEGNPRWKNFGFQAIKDRNGSLVDGTMGHVFYEDALKASVLFEIFYCSFRLSDRIVIAVQLIDAQAAEGTHGGKTLFVLGRPWPADEALKATVTYHHQGENGPRETVLHGKLERLR